MKLTKFNHLIALGLILGAAAVGCQSKKPGPITPLPGNKVAGVQDPGQGGAITGSPVDKPVESNPAGGPIPQVGGTHDGWTKNRDTFQADTVHFDYDMAKVKSSEKAHVSAVADYLRANGSSAVEIEGHCDERGTDEYNRALGERRAMALREELVRLGIEPNRVDTISYGRERPVDTGHSEASHRKNRRGEFVLLTAPNPR